MDLERSRRLRTSEAERRRRVQRLCDQAQKNLPTLTTSSLDGRSVQGHIENFLGTISLPLGMIGPLEIHSSEFSEMLLAPLATTEGALISSINRGALAISASGGVRAKVLKQEMTRAPQFEFNNIETAYKFSQWVLKQEANLAARVRRKSTHAELVGLEACQFGRTVHLRCLFTTGNAAGQNMTTFYAADFCRWICDQFELETGCTILDCMIEGNLSSDKKVSALSAMRGRGHSVTCETVIQAKVLKRILGLSVTEVISRFHRSKSARVYSGMVSYNINVANVVAGLFLATGQDAACIHESSLAELHLEAQGEDLYAALLMPSLVVATVGGGTQLPSARDALASIGCLGEKSSDRLAMIVASFSLALELSTLSAIGTGCFVKAHERHARELSSNFFRPSEFTADFFREILTDKTITKIERISVENREGHVSDLAFQVSKKYTGNLAFEITTSQGNTETLRQQTFLKVKASDREIVLGASRILASVDPGLAEILSKSLTVLPFRQCHVRELQVFQNKDSIFHKLSPRFLGSYQNPEREMYVLMHELLSEGDVISPVLDLEFWTDERKHQTLKAIQELHAIYFQNEAMAKTDVPSLFDMVPLTELHELEITLWDALGSFVQHRHLQNRPELETYFDQTLQAFPETMQQLRSIPQSIIHYDFSPRNLAFKQNLERPLIFDWEFTAWGPPQRDFVEFLIFVSKPETIVEDFVRHSQSYISSYSDISHRDIIRTYWGLGLDLSIQEFIVRRLPFFAVIEQMGACPYLPRLLDNLVALTKVKFADVQIL